MGTVAMETRTETGTIFKLLKTKSFFSIMVLLLQTMGSSICSIIWKEVISIGQDNQSTGLANVKRTYTVAEVMEILDVSRKMAYELCNSGSFKTVRVGRSIRISKVSFDEWLDKQS